MDISTCLLFDSQVFLLTSPFSRSFSTSLVQLLLLSIIRSVMSASRKGFGWLPLKILSTLNCSGEILNFLKYDLLIPDIQLAVKRTFITALWCWLANCDCFISSSRDMTKQCKYYSCIYKYKHRYECLNSQSEIYTNSPIYIICPIDQLQRKNDLTQ